jgi:hypothetical protein
LARPKPTTIGVAAAVLLTAVPVGSALTAEAAGGTSVDRRIQDNRISESSGLALSNRHRNVLYTHNDSGDGPRIYAVGSRGQTRAVLNVKGANARDWEDMSTGPRKTLWLGDIGDNGRSRSTIEVYRVKEPRRLHNQHVRSTSYTFRYPDGAHDAEALMVRPFTGRVFIATKESDGAALYRAPKSLSSTRVNRLQRIRSMPTKITAGAFEPRGGGFAVRNHNYAWVYNKLGSKPRQVKLPDMPQGESLEFTNSNRRLLAGSERQDSLVWSVRR